VFKKELYIGSKKEQYDTVCKQLDMLIKGESNIVANLANSSALLNFFLKDINWVGYYLYEETTNQLVIGPFQGLPACIRIPLGKGVCGTAAEELRVLRVEDVHCFQGHIACDSASKSEIVLPIMRDGNLYGVLDIDSPITERFDTEDEVGLTSFVSIIEKYL
jgi:GAF domain-containing protein